MLKFRQLCCFPWVGIIVSGRILCRTSCGALCMKIAIKIWNAYDCASIRQGETTMDMALQSGPQFFLRSQRVHYYPPLAVWMHCSMCPALYANSSCRLRRSEVYSLAVCSLTCSSATSHAGIPAWCFYFFRTTLPRAGISAHVFQLML